ncbi:hypothetical protein [uncultured Psychroserpens sp.]|uniref:hypothetical protein n=1 Tax=uncultured Psychroserpens sp. TaxID=255436 RepID=UPI002616586F|nr:hypothetical protein [uncultured Psychroserpens sp.]
MKKLTKEHIEDLYAFTIKHYVEHYDLQTEMVDHMANGIEAIWEKYPALSYLEARKKAFKKFGIFGFMEIVAERQKAMQKRYYKYLLKELRIWFKLPKIIVSITLFWVFYTAFSLIISSYLLITFFALIGIWTLYKSIQLHRQFRRRKEKSNKKWLLEEIIFKQSTGMGIIFFSQIFNIINFSDKLFTSHYGIISVSIVAVILTMVIYISFELLPKKSEVLLNETYPEYSL